MQRLIGSDAGLQMPPTGALPPDAIDVLRAWIDLVRSSGKFDLSFAS